jgi:hypothetical protein
MYSLCPFDDIIQENSHAVSQKMAGEAEQRKSADFSMPHIWR